MKINRAIWAMIVMVNAKPEYPIPHNTLDATRNGVWEGRRRAGGEYDLCKKQTEQNFQANEEKV